ncbi:EmrB/QacA subfamily drug resistance transporter [Trinickia symbiotica]|nr:EmrB/QacA subfamily drug resistance transporter [Trinickia symbiotica]
MEGTEGLSAPARAASPVRSFRELLLAMLGIGLVNMLVALDQTVVSTALPSIVADLKGAEYYAWIASVYLLASVVSVPIFGRLGDYFGRKGFVIASITTFTLASALCGLAPNVETLVFARALQGVGGGMMVGTAFASIPDLFPDPHARVRWQVVMAGSYGIATAAGPFLGGFLSSTYGWRSTFLVNLPVGLAGLYIVIRYLPRIAHGGKARAKIDWLGAAFLSVLLASLQMGIERLPTNGFGVSTLRFCAIAIGSCIALYAWEKRHAQPILPIDLFADRNLVLLFLLSFAAGFAMFSMLFFMPLLLQTGFGMTPQAAGLAVTPLPVCLALGSMVNTRIVTRLRVPMSIVTLGYALIGAGCFGATLLGGTSPHLLGAVSMAAAGVGLGFILNNLNVFSQELSGRTRFGIITGLIQSTRMVGGMLGTATIGTLVARSLARVVADPNHAALEQGQSAVVHAIHMGFSIDVVVMCGAVYCTRRLVGVRLRRSSVQSPLAE